MFGKETITIVMYFCKTQQTYLEKMKSMTAKTRIIAMVSIKDVTKPLQNKWVWSACLQTQYYCNGFNARCPKTYYKSIGFDVHVCQNLTIVMISMQDLCMSWFCSIPFFAKLFVYVSCITAVVIQTPSTILFVFFWVTYTSEQTNS